MIAVWQMDFIGKVVQREWYCPAKCMFTACCDRTCLKGRPEYQNKDALVKNLKFLFVNVAGVVINIQGSLK